MYRLNLSVSPTLSVNAPVQTARGAFACEPSKVVHRAFIPRHRLAVMMSALINRKHGQRFGPNATFDITNELKTKDQVNAYPIRPRCFL